jgi:phosphatidylethanolamine/phosphatidyl-N-methylethanolamine N-methyltransferase
MKDSETKTLSVADVEGASMEQAYAKLASGYNWMFGPALQAGRLEAVRRLPLRAGDEVLEVGIGTGLTATLYPDDCKVTGIDVSEPMLEGARKRIASRGLRNVRVVNMDAADLQFPDESFDLAYAAYVVSAVPDPVKVLQEMHRVCRVGGHIVLLNHFRSTGPILSRLEQLISPLTVRVGFRADLDLSALLSQAGLQAISIRKVNVPKIWSLVTCRKQAA